MLSLGKLAPGQHAYYVDSVARGAEEYYTGAKKAPGVWVGGGAERLGLAGEVDGERLGHFVAACGSERNLAVDVVAIGADNRGVRRHVLCPEVGVASSRTR